MTRGRPNNPEAGTGLAGVARLREARVRARGDQTLAADMDRALREAGRQRRASGGCADAWAKIIPPDLIERTALEGVSRGVLTVRVPDGATRFQLDRFLRSGGQRAFVAACSASLRQVRIVVGSGG